MEIGKGFYIKRGKENNLDFMKKMNKISKKREKAKNINKKNSHYLL